MECPNCEDRDSQLSSFNSKTDTADHRRQTYQTNSKEPVSPSKDSDNPALPVSFRFACFRPSIDEVLLGTVKSCTKSGIRVSINFFDDIYIPADKLRHPSRFDFEQGAWIWEYAYEGETAELRIDKNDTIRFRVVEELWRDPNPDGPKSLTNTNAEAAAEAEALAEDQPIYNAPYTLIGSIVADGLGVTCWWVN
ncbi:unnamed protein product [Echinostoma caproni]|uniref:RNA_pol_Rbc25 domain-containing protein n=1 Tax=Echinostoma caproni TaxID=27848 RepID=A0A183AL69_9TREM|nr:unnamed protein product [Echinostoma caproni]